MGQGMPRPHPAVPAPASRERPASLLELQRSIGNRAATRLLQRRWDGPVGAPFAARGGLRNDETRAALEIQGADGGQPLDTATRTFMESRLGADFGTVQVHADAAAGRLSRKLGAQAFTVGRHIFFAPGAYDSTSADGRRLLAHELTHVVQQSGAGARLLTLSTPGDPAEREAEQMGESVAAMQAPAPIAGEAPPARPAGRYSSGGRGLPIVQRRLIATGDIQDIVDFIFLVRPAIGLDLVHDPATNEITSIGPSAAPTTSRELRALLTTIMNDRTRDAEIHIGKGQAGIEVGGFPKQKDLSKGKIQTIDIDDVLNIEAGAPGNGLAKLGHEIAENYHAHSLTVVAGTDRFPESHRVGIAAEGRITTELIGPSGRVASVLVDMGGNLRTLVQDNGSYFLVYDQTLVPATGGVDVSNARRAPRVRVSTRRIDSFEIGVAAVPASGAATITAVVDDLTANPTAVARIEGFSDTTGPSLADNVTRSRQWAEATRDAIIASGTVGGVEGFNVVAFGALNPVAPNTTESNRRQNRRVVTTVERPGP
jgi:outer membrane protein OmpA-like peptidoglycan-associated protein